MFDSQSYGVLWLMAAVEIKKIVAVHNHLVSNYTKVSIGSQVLIANSI